VPLEGEARPEEGREALRGVARAQVAVLLVGLAEGVPQAPERGPLQVRRVHDQPPARLRDAGELGGEGGVVRHVLEHVDHRDAVERRVGERQGAARHEPHVLADERADGRDRLLGEVARGPTPAALAQKEAHDAVVGAEVEAAETVRRPQHRRDLGELPLLEDRAGEERLRPLAFVARVSHARA
jgi:hypothetical protein